MGKAMKGEKAGGYFFPITAVQRYDASLGEIENGTYFGYPFALTFRGPFEITGVRLLGQKMQCWPWTLLPCQ